MMDHACCSIGQILQRHSSGSRAEHSSSTNSEDSPQCSGVSFLGEKVMRIRYKSLANLVPMRNFASTNKGCARHVSRDFS